MSTPVWLGLAERFERLGDTSQSLHAIVWHNPTTPDAWEAVPGFDTFGRIDNPLHAVRCIPMGADEINGRRVLGQFTVSKHSPEQWRVLVFGRDDLSRVDQLAHEAAPTLPPANCPDQRPWQPLGLLLSHAAQVRGVDAWATTEAGVWRQMSGGVIVCPGTVPNAKAAIQRAKRLPPPNVSGTWVTYLPSVCGAIAAYLRQLQPPPRMRFDDATGTIYLDGKEKARHQDPDVLAYFKLLYAVYPNGTTFKVMKEKSNGELTNDTRTVDKMPASLRDLFESTPGKGKVLLLPPLLTR